MTVPGILLSLALLFPAPQQGASFLADFACMGEAIYFEAGNQHLAGKIAVANVILNRAKRSRAHPNSVCGVIHQPRQFSYHRDAKRFRKVKWSNPRERKSIENSYMVAFKALQYTYRDNTQGSLYYLNRKISKNKAWTKGLKHTVSIGEHTFYR